MTEQGDNLNQTFFNGLVVANVLSGVDMAEDAKQVVQLLIDQDVIGGALQGSFDQAALDALREKWPPRFADRFDDFMTIAYLCDTSAHSSYRSFIDPYTGRSPA